MAYSRYTPHLLLLFVVGSSVTLLSYNSKRSRSRQNVEENIEKLCLSSDIITNYNLRFSCKYLEAAKRSPLFLPEQLELENLEKLKFTKSPKPCNDTDLLVLVNSGSANKAKRQSIRETWKPALEKVGKISVFFISGFTMNDEVMKELLEEADLKKDIILLELIDEYRRISIKHIMMYKWMRDNCPSAKYLIKCDDDILIDPNQYGFLEHEFMQNQTMEIYGQLLGRKGVIRDGGKWGMPSAFYPLEHYPDYLNGPAVIQSKTVTMKFLEILPSLPIFGIDDVLIGGFAAALTGVTPVRHRSMNGPSPVKDGNWDRSIFSWVAGSAENIQSQWTNLTKHYRPTLLLPLD